MTRIPVQTSSSVLVSSMAATTRRLATRVSLAWVLVCALHVCCWPAVRYREACPYLPLTPLDPPFPSLPDIPGAFDSGRDGLLRAEEGGAGSSNGANGGDGGSEASPPIWTLAYYQYFFDIDTKEVGHRLLRATLPFRGKSFVDQINRRPDLWGKTWRG